MTEADQLKQEAHRQFVEQRVTALQIYLGELFDELDTADRYRFRGAVLFNATFLCHIVSGLLWTIFPSQWAEVNNQLAGFLVWIVIAREWLFIIPRYFGARDEIKGCLKTLEALGLVDPLDKGRRQKLHMAQESKMAKIWDWLKQKARQEAYQSA